jgi:hypothetical protein
MPTRWGLSVAAFCLCCLSACTGSGEATAMEDMADGFLAALSEGDYDKARRHLTNDLAARTSSSELEQFAAYTKLNRSGKRSWDDHKVNDENVMLSGTITPPDSSASIPLRLSLTKQQLHWKIAGIERGIMVSAAGSERALFAPSKEASIRLAQATTAAFADAVSAKNLATFRDQMSAEFRNRFPPQAFENAFGGFIRDRINVAPAARLTPIFTQTPTIAPNGVVTLAGYFPSKPSQVAFKYEYISERPNNWVLSGISLEVQPK